MKVKAIKSFVGRISMNVGDVKDIQSKEVLNDLLSAGYVEAVDDKPKAQPKAEPKAKPTTKKTPKNTTTKKTKK